MLTCRRVAGPRVPQVAGVLAVAMAMTFASGCPGTTSSTIELTITADADVPDVDALEIVVQNGMGSERVTFIGASGPFVFPVLQSVPTSLTGTVNIFVIGTTGGSQIASGTTVVSVPGGDTVTAEVNLSVGVRNTPCGDCSGLSSPGACINGECNLVTGTCNSANSPDGFPCDDSSPCTTGEACSAGTCGGGTVMDCSMLDDVCNVGTCDDFAGCIVAPRMNGLPCDDGLECTENEACFNGTCSGGTTLDCSFLAQPPCGVGMCIEGMGCVASFAPDGTPCDDGDSFCTTSDACVAGFCVGTPVADGSFCSDGAACTAGDQCVGGVCQSGGPADCSAVADMCNIGICTEPAGTCVPMPVMDGTVCDDGIAQICTSGDECAAGVCIPVVAVDGTLCDDGITQLCNINDACSSGVCLPVPEPDGTLCDDGINQLCTINDACTGGACLPVPEPDGTPCDDGEPTCTINDMCMGGMCVTTVVPDGTFCDDGDPVCTPTQDTCTAGSCVGMSVCIPPILLNESFGGTPDYIEIVNTSGSIVDIGNITLEWDLCDVNSWTFAPGTMVAAGGTYRLVENTTTMANEDGLGSNLCDNPASSGWIALCDGPCDRTLCSNYLDYLEKGTTVTAPAPCLSFTPGPASTTGEASTESLQRMGFAGSGTAGVAADWAIAPFTRF